ncbi:hypothetical protein MTQ12_11765 [Brevibacterium sp. R8603A2]|uniref:hypothetical protein n=1 Tax=Brevibacterium sp. R8603A2 TaxID=2929779 RepID=UPI001FF9AD53|nr:hypothetical protein [Brevibacterium sp. R8603A2]MCK1803715.1 hypothetical protein [Brevibacterium sp. R8603A2]
MSTQSFTAIAGYAALLVSAVGYLVCRSVLVGFMDGGVDVVPSLVQGISSGTLAVVAGAVGAWLLVPERRLAVVLGLGFLLTAGPTLVGAIFDLSDFLAGGYNAIGTIILIMIGNSVLPFGAVLALLIAVWSAVRQLRARRAPRTPPPPS